ncbi:hypothetical protein ACFE33_14460 [Falsihalocynthiibacter sp. SS001]|uniref:hypothetical protein n=1 Tax=Falsihalocynthiibacter sp. SS001 TaxID=3349698 RepID=UPI0036D3789F
MPKANKPDTLEAGRTSRLGGTTPLVPLEVVAAALSIVWVLAAGTFLLIVPSEATASAPTALKFVATLLVVFLPVAVIWVGVVSLRSARIIREETARLQASIDAMRMSYVEQQQATSVTTIPSVVEKLDQIVTAQRQTESAITTFATTRTNAAPTARIRPTALPNPDADAQQALALGTSIEDITPPLSTADFIRAVNFPENAEDKEGFAALRRALKDREAARLIQSSQDILTLLSQDGIYMDDLRPERASPEIWRHFAKGERGRSVAALGGIRDRSCLALTAARMRQDPIFRDTSHHFLRQFDKSFIGFEEGASDIEIAELTDTRTARAFMLLGRVSGTFD